MANFDEYWEKLKKICKAHPKGKPYDAKGNFYPDPTPVAPPVGNMNVADIDMFEVMKQRIRNEISISAQLEGRESFEEADDFEVEDDFEPFSPWEEIVEQAIPDGPVVRPDPPASSTSADPSLKPATPPEGAQAPAKP